MLRGIKVNSPLAAAPAVISKHFAAQQIPQQQTVQQWRVKAPLSFKLYNFRTDICVYWSGEKHTNNKQIKI